MAGKRQKFVMVRRLNVCIEENDYMKLRLIAYANGRAIGSLIREATRAAIAAGYDDASKRVVSLFEDRQG